MVHEWALAESILDYLARSGKSRFRKVIIRVGALQSIDLEILTFGLQELSKERGLVIEEVSFDHIPVSLRCNSCGYEWSMSPDEFQEDVREAVHFVPEAVYAYVRCPRCGSRDFAIVRGRGIEGVEVIEDGGYEA